MIKGFLTGTSQSDLATQAMTLRGYANQRKVIWIDASDQYQGYCELVRIIELDGPNLDASKGILTADFTLKAAMLLPWGTTFTNPFHQTGIVLRDLNGQGIEYMLNPLEMNCNFQINNPNTSSESFSWEFILDNQSAFTNATSLQLAPCTSLNSGPASQSNPVATNNPASIAHAFDSIAIDTSNYPESLGGSLEGTKANPTTTDYGLGYDFGTTGLNLSSFDRLRLWFRCDQSGMTNYVFFIIDASGNYRQWVFSLQAANTWINLEFAIAIYTTQSGSVSLNSIQYVGAYATVSGSPSSIHIWLGDIRAEIGYINHCFDTNVTAGYGTGMTLSNDITVYKQSPQLTSYTTENWKSSLRNSGTSSGSGAIGVNFQLPIGGWNLSNYDFLVLWARSDFGGGSSNGSFTIYLITAAGTSYYTFAYTSLYPNEWYRLVLPLRSPNSTTGSPNLGNITEIDVISNCLANTVTNIWISEITTDVGNWINLESLIPDNVNQSINPSKNVIQISSWTGSSYEVFQYSDALGGSGANNGNNPYCLNGTSVSSYYSGQNNGIYVPGTVNSSANLNTNVNTGNGLTLTYQPLWGTNNRLAFQIKLPPATSDSVSGNLPSNDLSGFQAVSKVRLKILIYCSNEDTTYVGN